MWTTLLNGSGVEVIDVTSEGLEAVANVAAGMDAQIGAGRFAIVVGNPLSYGLSRMYEAFREMNAASSRRVMTFHRLEDAFDWLDDRPAR